MATPSNCTSCTTSRRSLLRGVAGLGGAAGLALLPSRAAFATDPEASTGNTVVLAWLRGGMDALSAVMPLDDRDHLDARREIAVTPDAGLPLDDRFGLHPAMGALREWFDEGELAVVNAIGNPEPTRSHFEAMDELERGTPGSKAVTSGWLGRWLSSAATTSGSPFRAVGLGTMLPASLRGYGSALALSSVADFHVDAPARDRAAVSDALAALHDAPGDPLGTEAEKALAAITSLADSPAPGLVSASTYPSSPLGRGLQQVAALVRAEVGLEVATVDGGGWDTHTSMGTPERGTMRDQLADLSGSLAAFAADLSAAGMLGRVTLVTMSEFGRRVQVNSSGGTDHGRATASFVLGGGVAGGRVHGSWPGLGADQLVPVGGAGDTRGDLAVTTDWRDLLTEVLVGRLREADLSEVFPDFTPASLGVVGT